MADIVETFQLKYGVLHRERWGMGDRFVRGANDEEIDLPNDAEEAVMLREDVPLIPRELWKRVQMLYVACMERDPGMKLLKSGKITKQQYESKVGGPDKQSEVMVCFALSDDRQKWIIGVPRQSVGKAHVYADYDKGVIDIATGKQYKYWPPEGYFAAGTSHSHNTFGAYFSGTDDANELHQPGLHMVCGEYNTQTWDYKIATSVVMGKKRYRKLLVQKDDGSLAVENLNWDSFVDANIAGLDDLTLPKKVWKYVLFETPASWKAVWEQDKKKDVQTKIIYPPALTGGTTSVVNTDPLPGVKIDGYHKDSKWCYIRKCWVLPFDHPDAKGSLVSRSEREQAMDYWDQMYGGDLSRDWRNDNDWSNDSARWHAEKARERAERYDEQRQTVKRFLEEDDTLKAEDRVKLEKEIMQFYTTLGRELRSILQSVKQMSFLVNERQALRMVASALRQEYKFGEDHL